MLLKTRSIRGTQSLAGQSLSLAWQLGPLAADRRPEIVPRPQRLAEGQPEQRAQTDTLEGQMNEWMNGWGAEEAADGRRCEWRARKVRRLGQRDEPWALVMEAGWRWGDGRRPAAAERSTSPFAPLAARSAAPIVRRDAPPAEAVPPQTGGRRTIGRQPRRTLGRQMDLQRRPRESRRAADGPSTPCPMGEHDRAESAVLSSALECSRGIALERRVGGALRRRAERRNSPARTRNRQKGTNCARRHVRPKRKSGRADSSGARPYAGCAPLSVQFVRRGSLCECTRPAGGEQCGRRVGSRSGERGSRKAVRGEPMRRLRTGATSPTRLGHCARGRKLSLRTCDQPQ